MMHAPTLKTVFWLIVCQLNRGIHPSQGAAILAVHFVPICCGTKWTAQLPSDLHCVGCKQSLHHAVHIFDINRPRRHLEVVAITSGHSWKLVVELRYPCPNPKDRQKNCECFRRQRMLRSGQGSFRDPQMDTRLSPVLFLSQRNFEHVQNFLISSMRQEKSQKLNVWRTFATQRTLTNSDANEHAFFYFWQQSQLFTRWGREKEYSCSYQTRKKVFLKIPVFCVCVRVDMIVNCKNPQLI